jgi:hypothetical protein
METEQAVFEGWAIVEMMGHQQEIGFVKTQAFGQAVMFRIDTPELPEREYTLTVPEYVAHSWTPAGAVVKRAASPARSRLVSPGALYAINPCTEEAARTAIERSSSRPLIVVSVPPAKAIDPSFELEDDFDSEDDSEDDSVPLLVERSKADAQTVSD